MNANAEIFLLPKTSAEMAQIREDYSWLTKALSEHCDQVLDKFYEGGNMYAIAVVWQRGQVRERFAFPVESREMSVNREIRENRMTRTEAVRAFTKTRPSWR